MLFRESCCPPLSRLTVLRVVVGLLCNHRPVVLVILCHRMTTVIFCDRHFGAKDCLLWNFLTEQSVTSYNTYAYVTC